MEPPGHKALRKGRFSIPGGLYFLTFCTQNRTRTLACNPVWRAVVQEITASETEGTATVHTLILMPDHVHALATLGHQSPLGAWIARFKTRVRNATGVAWQRGFYDHWVRKAEALGPIYNYILRNPERSGLIRDGSSWPYSWVHPKENHGFDVGAAISLPPPDWL